MTLRKDKFALGIVVSLLAVCSFAQKPNLPNDTTAAGDVIFAEIATPLTNPAAGRSRFYIDSILHLPCSMSATGVVSCIPASQTTTVNGVACTLGSTCTVTAVPSGAAGGDLGSTYPNPTVVAMHLSLAPTLCTAGNYSRGIDANGNATGCTAAGGGSGTVTTTGSPASGNLTKFSGATSITNADLTGDVTTSGGVATTLANTAVTPASYTNANLTVDSKGRITAASNGSAGGGGLTLLCSAAAAGVASIAFDATHNCSGANPFTSTYDAYVIYVDAVTVTTNSAFIKLQFSTNSGSTYDTSGVYYWDNLVQQIGTGTTGTNGLSAQTAIALFADSASAGLLNTANPGMALQFTLFDPLSSANYKLMVGRGIARYAVNGNNYAYNFDGFYLNTNAVNSFQLLTSTGNFSGNIRVFGMAH